MLSKNLSGLLMLSYVYIPGEISFFDNGLCYLYKRMH